MSTVLDTPDGPCPEVYYLPPTPFVPNSPMPYLVYRNAMPLPVTVESCEQLIERNGWTRYGPVWGPVAFRHFHPNVHECYGVISGSSEVMMGVGTSDVTSEEEDCKDSAAQPKVQGLRITLRAGDVVVHPAGTAHSNINGDNYQFLSFFPTGAPKYKSSNGSRPLNLEEMRAQTMAVPFPQDPVYGNEGHLTPLWNEGRKLHEQGERP